MSNSLGLFGTPPGSSVHGILQARILQWVAIPPPGVLADPGIKPMSPESPELAGEFFTTSAVWEAQRLLYGGLNETMDVRVLKV